MKRLLFSAALCFALVIGSVPGQPGAWADSGGSGDNNAQGWPVTLAVFGDWPYSLDLVAVAPLLIDSINGDRDVSGVIHVGDIHSGSMPCTGAGLNPRPAGSNPIWNYGVFGLFPQFNAPLVYTPGDNEWTDCHKTKQLSSGAPLNELAAVRSSFLPVPGVTLGGDSMRVLSQAQASDPAHPADAEFVENVMWRQADVVFVTLNVPGSNNDGLPWTAPFTDETARTAEVAKRDGANTRWLQRAFQLASQVQARGVLIALQADMWDPAALAPGGDGLGGYTDFVRTLANLALGFNRPVLLINGDSHVYETDQPLADPSSTTGQIHGTPAVPNLTRITVQGSTNKPREWLRLTVDPHSPGVFSWQNVIYCDNTTCPN